MRLRKPNSSLSGKLVEAQWAGKALQDAETGIWAVGYHGDCKSPPTVRQHSPEGRLARISVRCRKCSTCRRAMRNYWGYAAMQQTLLSAKEGGRTWFGTLTCNADWHAEMLAEAMKRAKDPSVDWRSKEPVTYWCNRRKRLVTTERLVCEETFKLLTQRFLHEVQKYWKRLRNDGHSFKYLAVFEPHKSGRPHCHFLLHELRGDRILKRELRDRWPCGFIGATLVGGTARQAADPDKAAWYAVKYLSKHTQTRVRASRGYVPEKRAEPHSSHSERGDTNSTLERSEKVEW